MKHIYTTATVISRIKSEAKKLKKSNGLTLSECLEIAAKTAGYESFYHANTCFKKSQPVPGKYDGLSLSYSPWNPPTMHIEVDNEDLLHHVTDS